MEECLINNSSPFALICANCTTILRPPYIVCTECPARQVTLCPQCFSLGCEVSNAFDHKNDHSYQIVVHHPSLFRNSPLDASEEMQFISTVETLNGSNWSSLKSLVSNPASHYEQYYIKGPMRFTWNSRKTAHTCKDHTKGAKTEFRPNMSSFVIHSTMPKVLAYLPLRGDFGVEWENQMDALLKDSILLPDFDETDRALILALISQYVTVLRERAKRRQLVHEHRLMEKFKKIQKNPKRAAAAKPTTESKLRHFAQFIPEPEFRSMMQDLAQMTQLRKEVAILRKGKRLPKKTQEKSVQVKPVGQEDGQNVEGTEKRETPLKEDESLLNAEEQALCASLQITHTQYTVLKAFIINQYARRRRGFPFRVAELTGPREAVEEFLKETGVI